MARPGLFKHRKFRRLSRDIGSIPLALGLLELLWSQCYENGEDYLGDSSDVESAAHWEGAPGMLTVALLSAGGEGEPGFIEEVAERPGHYVCHDLYDHAPEYVRKRMDREAARRSAGVTLRDLRAAAGRASGERRRMLADGGGHTEADGEQTSNTCRTDGTPPTPTPIEKELPPVSPKGGLKDLNGSSKRRTKSQILLDFSEETKAVVNALAPEWRKEQPDGAPIDVRVPDFAQAVEAIRSLKNESMTVDVLVEAGRMYLASKRKNYKAPQWFFSTHDKNQEKWPWIAWARMAWKKLNPKSPQETPA